MAWYPKATRKNVPPGPNDPPIKARVVILHVAESEASSLYPYFNGPSGGVESHFYVRYDGTVEQYRDTAYQADANVMANDFAISIETQGLGPGTWTTRQLAAIKALILWCHKTHGVPLVVCPRWDGSGVGYHTLFEAQWDQRGASCPGPNRINQFKTVLVPWMAAGAAPTGGFLMALSDADQQKILDAANRVLASGTASPRLLNDGDGNTLRNDVGHARDQLVAAIRALATGLGPTVEAAVAKALDAKYDATVTLSPKES